MKFKGPIVTLAAGLTLAAVLLVVNLVVTGNRDATDETTNTAATSTTTAAATVAPTTAAPAGTQPAAEGTQVTYAGNVNGGGASIAIAVKDGKAIAYFCDGRSAEAWLQGTFAAGKLTLTGEKNASLNANVANGSAVGSVNAGGRTFAFTIKNVAPPSGLYRAAANVNNAKLVGGWIVLPDGTQTGLATVGESTVVPGPINTSNGTATVGSSTVTATKLDGSSL
jgi:hypothetical protein